MFKTQEAAYNMEAKEPLQLQGVDPGLKHPFT